MKIPRLAAVLAALALTPAARAQGAPVKPVAEWKGSVADLSLQKAAPAGGVLVSRQAFEELCKAWKVDTRGQEVDFSKDLALVATTRGSLLTLSAALDEHGNLRVLSKATRDLRPGFRYHILTVRREGVKTVNGKPLPAE